MAAFGTIVSTTDVVANVIQYATPVSTDNVTVNAGTTVLIINPAATIAALTVTLPAAPASGQTITICSTQIVTALTISSVKTVVLPLTAFILGGSATYMYYTTNAVWVRIG